MKRILWVGVAFLASWPLAACSGDDDSDDGKGGAGTGGGGTSGNGGTGGKADAATGGAGGSGGSGGSGGNGGNAGGGGSAGTDAGTGGNAGSGGNAGQGAAGGDGGNAKTCEMLNSDYVAALPAAKKCAYGTSPNPCSSTVESDLECQCPTYINPANTAAVAELTKIKAAWTAKGCVASPTCLCANPQGGACYAGPGGPSDGNCSDTVAP